MQNYLQHLWLTVKRLLLVLIFYTICRVFFFILNTGYFGGSSFATILLSFIGGIRFDIAAIVFTNIWLIFWLLPGNYKNSSSCQNVGKWLFISINSFALLLNFIDARFFDFINKRSTTALFTLMTSNSDVWKVLLQILKDYWYVAALWILAVIGFWKLTPTLKNIQASKTTFKTFSLEFLAFCLVSGLMLLGARGTGLKPLSITDAASPAGSKHVPLVLNTTFSILKTIENENLKEYKWFEPDTLNAVYNPVHSCRCDSLFKKHNVVIFILESFSKEYCGFLGGVEGYTPNLDSILGMSLVFPNAFANGTQSYEAMPAIIAGIPSLMDKPYSGSNYADNYIAGLPALLKQYGYSTSFFHGGNNGTMGFSSFAPIAGIDRYFGRNEYGNNQDFDGFWGISDEPFLKYFADQLTGFQEPFITAVFTLSSHHPFHVPEKYKDRFKEGELPILKSIAYADYALGEFFKIASTRNWYNNTLFVFTADHAALALKKEYNHCTDMFSIPLAFYHPSDEKLQGIDSTIAQQIDILPTVLDYLNFPEDYFAFGNSLIRSHETHHSVSYVNGIYQLVEDGYVMQFDGANVISFTGISGNPADLSNPTVHTLYREMEKKTKAIIQTYNHSLIHNKAYLPAQKDKL